MVRSLCPFKCFILLSNGSTSLSFQMLHVIIKLWVKVLSAFRELFVVVCSTISGFSSRAKSRNSIQHGKRRIDWGRTSDAAEPHARYSELQLSFRTCTDVAKALLALFHGTCKGVHKSISWLAASDIKLLTGEQYGWLLDHVGVGSYDRPCQGEGVNWLVIGF